MSSGRNKPAKSSEQLRSARWMVPDNYRGFNHRSRIMQMGYDPEDWVGKPFIAIINTWSDTQQCHAHFKERVEHIKRGIFQAGGFPIELPAISLSEITVKPTTMLYRNMLAMETEELLRSHPIDGAVLMGGCDKTTPGLVLGAVSMGLPFVYVPAGPMLSGHFEGQTLGSGTDGFKFYDQRRAGLITTDQWQGIETGIARSYGHCMTMGTASTMTAIADVLGLTLPGASSILAADANHQRMCAASGRRIVDMVWQDLTPDELITEASVRNASIVSMAMGCSTNAVIHLLAMARRAGVTLTLDDLDKVGREVPLIANIRPIGKEYLMQDFYFAGGLLALMSVLRDRLNLETLGVNGKTLGENLEGVKVHNTDVIRSLDNPIYPQGSLAVLRGNLAPQGAVIKPAACDPKFYQHTGPAMIADSYEEMLAIIEDENLDISPDTVLVLRNAGPQGGPGMPEWGMIPMPKSLLKRGIFDMVRLSDARMSGTSFGACVLHVAPESFIGGPLALLQNGDLVEMDVPNRSLNMLVDDAEIERRRSAWVPPKPHYQRGYGWMFSQHIQQADEGCDFDFLTTEFGAPPDEPAIN